MRHSQKQGIWNIRNGAKIENRALRGIVRDGSLRKSSGMVTREKSTAPSEVYGSVLENVSRGVRALRKVSDAGCVIDLAAGRVAWLFDSVVSQPCARAVLLDPPGIVE